MLARRGFTLIELLVVVGILAVLTGLLIPAIGNMTRASRITTCLNNVRSVQYAHFLYMQDNKMRFIQVGLAHGAPVNEEIAWINTLAPYYGHEDVMQSPLDASPHWPLDEGGEGVPIPGTTDSFRRTSYGCNNFLTQFSPAAAITGDPDANAHRYTDVRNPSTTVHFLVMAFEGDFAGADHVHVENWWLNPAVVASSQVQTNAARGTLGEVDARSNYGFLDGSIATKMFADVYTNRDVNLFDPAVSWQVAARSQGDAR